MPSKPSRRRSRSRRRRRHPPSLRIKPEQIDRLRVLLEQKHGRPRWKRLGPCLDVLVLAMLAQNTQVANARSGFRQLRRAFRCWRDVMNADIRDVQRCIAVCGLARMRARRLQRLLRTIDRQHGRLDLEYLGGAKPQAAYEYLTSFFGIGPKTAAYTLLLSFGTPMFPVDNGIHRMARRLRLVRAKAGHEETSLSIMRHLQPEHCYPLHALMFAHAKRICRPRNPKCAECPLSEICPAGKARVKHLPREDPLPRRMRPVILSRIISAGIPKHGDAEDAAFHPLSAVLGKEG